MTLENNASRVSVWSRDDAFCYPRHGRPRHEGRASSRRCSQELVGEFLPAFPAILLRVLELSFGDVWPATANHPHPPPEAQVLRPT